MSRDACNLAADGSITRAWLVMLANEGHCPIDRHCIDIRDDRIIVDGVVSCGSWSEARELLMETPA